MNWLIILFGVIATIANVTSDEIKFRWDRFFGKLFKKGSKAEQWFNPSKSWSNKWIGKSKLIDFLLSTVFVWATDFWHLLKLITINSVYGMVLLALGVHWSAVEWLVAMVGLNIAWGVIFELFFTGIYGALSDIVKQKK